MSDCKMNVNTDGLRVVITMEFDDRAPITMRFTAEQRELMYDALGEALDACYEQLEVMH